MAKGSNTAGNSKVVGRPFTKNDPRINRNGRPKSFDALRELAQQVSHEKVKVGGQSVVIDGHSVTVAEMIVRTWAQSKNPVLQKAFIEIAFGKTPDNLNINSRTEDVSVVLYLPDNERDSDTTED